MAKDKNDKMSLPMDYAIKSSKVRLVGQDGQTTIMLKDDAIARAKEEGKNLVQIAFNPSVFPGSICKIIDYAKFKYDEKKRQKEYMHNCGDYNGTGNPADDGGLRKRCRG